MNATEYITHFFQGHSRSVLAKKNIAASFAIKGTSIAVNLMLVPLTLDYLDPTKYGLWLTISSIVSWIGFFDIGLGNGLRNRLAEAIADGNYQLAKKYVSTTYVALLAIVGSIYLVFLLVNRSIDWSGILNAPLSMSPELQRVAFVLFTFFSLQFVLRLVGTIFVATQMPSVSNGISLFGNLLALGGIFMLTKFTTGSLFLVTLVYSVSPVVVFGLASIWFFRKRFRAFAPSIGSVDMRYFKDLSGLGLQFFMLQMSALVIFSTDNVIISHILGPAAVTPYNIAYKYFTIVTLVFGIVLAPFWSAFTDASAKGDTGWIRRSVRKLVLVWTACVVIVFLMLAFSHDFYLFWVGDKVRVPLLLSALMGLYIIISTWNNIFGSFINGVGKIRLQMYYALGAMLVNIPVSVFFARNLGMGSAGVILGTCVSLFFGAALAPIQYRKLINGTARGIWAR